MAKKDATYCNLWKPEELIFLTEWPLCGSVPDASIAARRRDRLGLKLCNICGLLFVDPRPSDDALTHCYGQPYFTSHARWSPIGPNRNYLSSMATGQLLGYNEIVSNLDLRDKAVLEIGCASGALLHSLQQHMPARLVGIDIAEAPIKLGQDRYGIDLRCTSLTRAGLSQQEFDVILMLDVIEHVANVADSIAIAGRRWTYLYAGLEHLVYLSPRTLDLLASDHGMICSKTWTDGCPAIVPYINNFDSHPRLRRATSEPVKALLNYFSRCRFAKMGANGPGLNFFAIIRTPQLSLPLVGNALGEL
jgi:hypothetical protein